MQRATLDLWVGFFVVAGVVAILFLALKVGNLGSFDNSETYQIKASFDNVGGLKPRAPVKSAGVVVGRVAEISFDPTTYEATVILSIATRYPFPRDSSAWIITPVCWASNTSHLKRGGAARCWSTTTR